MASQNLIANSTFSKPNANPGPSPGAPMVVLNSEEWTTTSGVSFGGAPTNMWMTIETGSGGASSTTIPTVTGQTYNITFPVGPTSTTMDAEPRIRLQATSGPEIVYDNTLLLSKSGCN